MSPASFRRIARQPRSMAVSATVVAAVGVAAWAAFPGASSSAQPVQTAVADRGKITVSVNGSGPVSVSGSIGASPATSPKSGGVVPAGNAAAGLQIYPQASGQVVRFLVSPGQGVRLGQSIAQISDQTAASTVDQALAAAQSAQLTLSGTPPTGSELAAADLAVRLAERKRSDLSAPATRAAVTAARLDLANAKLAYGNAVRSPGTPTPGALRAARLAVTLAQQKLAAAYQPPSATTVLAAEAAVNDAQAKLNALLVATPGPAPSVVRDAQTALTLAKQHLVALKNPTPAELAAAQQAVDQAQTTLDTLRSLPPGADPAAVAAAQQQLTLARQSLAALTAPRPTPAAVAAAQRDVRQARQSLASLQSSASPPSPAALAAAQQAVTQAEQHLTALLSSPQLAAVSQAQLDLASATVAWQNLQRASTSAPNALRAAELALRLAREKLAQLSAPPTAASLAQARLDVANARLALQALRRRGAPISPAELVLDQLKLRAAVEGVRLARLHQSLLTVRAPVAGTITSVLASVGAQVDPTVVLATVADLTHLSVTVNMSEFDVAHVQVGNRAVVNVAALGGTALPARVVSVAPVGVSNAGVVQFPVTVVLQKAAKGLRPGMLASVDVVTAERQRVVRVPLIAIGSVASGANQGQSTVTVMPRSGKSVVRFVDLGLAGQTYVEVVRGLKAGERVVLPQLATGSGGAGNNAPAGIGVPPPSADQGNQGGG